MRELIFHLFPFLGMVMYLDNFILSHQAHSCCYRDERKLH